MVESQPPLLPDPNAPRHRAAGLSGARRRAIVALVAALVLAAIGTGFVLMGGHDKAPKAAPPAPRTTSIAPAPVPTPTPTPTPTKTVPPKPVIPHEVVSASGPNKMRFDGPNFTIKAHVCAMPDVRPLDPPGEQEHTVCWVDSDDGFGGKAPASKSTGTTYMIGHSWAENPREVLNPISIPSTKEILNGTKHYVPSTSGGTIATYPIKSMLGSMLTLWTPTGKLQYKVKQAYGAGKLDLGYVSSMMDSSIKNRVVLFTCSERNGVDYDYDVVLYAYLYSSQKRTPTT